MFPSAACCPPHAAAPEDAGTLVQVPMLFTTTCNAATMSVPATAVLEGVFARPGWSALLISEPSSGALGVSPNGSFTYAHAKEFTGTVSFILQAQRHCVAGLVTNATGNTTISISVSPVPPSITHEDPRLRHP